MPGANASQQSVVDAAHATGSPGGGLCAAWVSNVFSNAGYGFVGGNADDMYRRWCHSSDKSQLKVGMIVAVDYHEHTVAGRSYGHVGIYVGNGQVMHNIGTIETWSLDEWINYYGAWHTVRWGWLGGTDLS